MELSTVFFYLFAALTIGAGIGVIAVKNPVHSALFLVFAFISSAGLWLLLESEFLALILIFVYVGAVMTLFLFVVMMINVKKLPSRGGFVRYLPFAILVMVLLVAIMLVVLEPQHFAGINHMHPAAHSADYSNTQALGLVLYTHYVYAFELAAVLLLVAIVAAISLGFRGRKPNTKSQRPQDQIKVRAEDRIRIVKMSSSSKPGTTRGDA